MLEVIFWVVVIVFFLLCALLCARVTQDAAAHDDYLLAAFGFLVTAICIITIMVIVYLWVTGGL